MYKNKILGGDAGDCSEEFSGRPLYQSYEVDVDGVMFAGEYPGDREEVVARRKIAQMHSFLLPSDMTHYRFPIRDVSVPKDTESVMGLIQRIDELKTLGGYVYIHCWGGVGRTGTIVACYISAHKRELDANQVLATLRGFFSMMPKSSRRKTPDSRSQVSYIKNFVQANVSCKEQCVDRVRDAIRGSLMAGAAGDALGYAVEFNSRSSILARYGERGITQFALNAEGKALISDDTQMTLFTANGLLNAIHLQMEPQCAVARAYVDWYYTQIGKPNRMKSCWISDIDALHSLRAPGNTCMSALDAITRGQEPCNNSKGCGGVMRVAPVGLFAHSKSFPFKNWKDGDLIKFGAECAKITHGHPAGWLSAGLFAHLIYEIVGRSMYKRIDRAEFEHIVGTAGHYMVAYFNSSPEYVYPLLTMILKALELAKQAIEIDQCFAQALSTAALCCGLLHDKDGYDRYYRLAISNGYDGRRIVATLTRMLTEDPNEEDFDEE